MSEKNYSEAYFDGVIKALSESNGNQKIYIDVTGMEEISIRETFNTQLSNQVFNTDNMAATILEKDNKLFLVIWKNELLADK